MVNVSMSKGVLGRRMSRVLWGLGLLVALIGRAEVAGAQPAITAASVEASAVKVAGQGLAGTTGATLGG